MKLVVGKVMGGSSELVVDRSMARVASGAALSVYLERCRVQSTLDTIPVGQDVLCHTSRLIVIYRLAPQLSPVHCILYVYFCTG